MSSGKLVAIGGLAVLAVGGGMYWFFGIHMKDQQRGAAQTEILAWETRLQAARDCMLGASPGSANSAEALAIKELSPDPWEAKKCTKVVGAISRGAAADTGMMDIEHAWMTLDRAASKVAVAYAVHKDPWGMSAADKRMGVEGLPEALAGLDAAHADLRKTAGMAPLGLGNAKLQALAKAELIPLALGGQSITQLDRWTAPSRSTLVFDAATAKGQAHVRLVAGGAPRIVPTNMPALIAVPEPTWFASTEPEQLVTGDVSGAAFGTPTPSLALKNAFVMAVVGGRSDGTVVYTQNIQGKTERDYEARLTFARATGGTFAVDPTSYPNGGSRVAVDVAGLAVVAWGDPAPVVPDDYNVDDEAMPTPMHAAFVRPGAAPEIVELGRGAPGQLCLTEKHAWLTNYAHIAKFDDTTTTSFEQPMAGLNLIACSNAAALLADGGTSYGVCTDQCRTVSLRGARATQVATLAGDQVIAVRALNGVLAVWREAKEPAFFSIPEGLEPQVAVSDGKVLDIVAAPLASREKTDAKVVLLRVPLS